MLSFLQKMIDQLLQIVFYKSVFYKSAFYKSVFYKSVFYKSVFYKSVFYKSSPCFTNPIQSMFYNMPAKKAMKRKEAILEEWKLRVQIQSTDMTFIFLIFSAITSPGTQCLKLTIIARENVLLIIVNSKQIKSELTIIVNLEKRSI